MWVPNPPSTNHAIAGATVIANLSASDETVGKDTYNEELVNKVSRQELCQRTYMLDAGEGESTTDLVLQVITLLQRMEQLLPSQINLPTALLMVKLIWTRLLLKEQE